eukprot:518048_1
MSFGEFECTTSICSSNTTAHYGSYVVCNDAKECASNPILCTEGQDCDVICSDYKSCQSTQIICSQDCYVICSGYQGCNKAHIICSEGMDCIVECTGSDLACGSATIDGPINGNLTVSCTGTRSCQSARINCPVDGVCHVDATDASRTPSDSLVIDAADMISGTFTVYSARSGTVKCPAEGVDCNVICGKYGCLGTTFNTQNNTKLRIIATGLQSLKSSNIYCPYPYGECTINVESTASDALTNADIFSVNGPDAFDLFCNYSLASEHCYSESNPPKLLCRSDYKATCTMSFGEFECTTSICSSNTTAHYGSYVVCNDAKECASNPILCTEGQQKVKIAT